MFSLFQSLHIYSPDQSPTKLTIAHKTHQDISLGRLWPRIR